MRSADTLARLVGDEFVILSEDITDVEHAELMARRVEMDLAQPYQLEGRQVFCTTSIGIVIGGREYERPEDVLRDADIAMYRAKLKGRSRSVLFTSEMRQEVIGRLELEIELRGALEREEFVVYYQPVVELDGLSVIGFEALVRWQHPHRGLVMPGAFIPLAEEIGLINPMGKWIMREACRQLKVWQMAFPNNPPLKMAINLSVRQFSQPEFEQQVVQIMKDTGISPGDVYLEITESVLVSNPEIKDTLANLRQLGTRIQLDDFGTGYSSLSYLHQLPVDAIKIDRSFIQQIGTAALSVDERTGPEIVRTIITLGQTLGMQVIGEGVETRLQLTQLQDLGCRYVQGFLFFRPMDAEQISTLLSGAAPTSHILQNTFSPDTAPAD